MKNSIVYIKSEYDKDGELVRNTFDKKACEPVRNMFVKGLSNT